MTVLHSYVQPGFKVRVKTPAVQSRTIVFRLLLPSPATDTDTEREKHFPGEALLGLLVTKS